MHNNLPQFQTDPTLYKHPDIREKTLKDIGDHLSKKRVQRIVLAQKYKQSLAERAAREHSKESSRFAKKVSSFETSMLKLEEDITKLHKKYVELNDLHSTLTNLESNMESGN